MNVQMSDNTLGFRTAVDIHATYRDDVHIVVTGHDNPENCRPFVNVSISCSAEKSDWIMWLYLSPEQARSLGEQLLDKTAPPPVVDVLYEVNAWRDGLEENN